MTRYTDEEILSHLSDFYHKNGRSPTKHEFSKANGYISGWVVVDRFGSWNVGLEKAGIPKNTRQVKNNTWCRNSIMNYTKEYINKYNKFPNSSSENAPSFTTIKRYFTNWEEIYNLVGSKKIIWTENLIIQAITDFYHQYKRVPTSKDFRANTLKYPNSHIINKYFKSWNNAIAKANLPITTKNGYGNITKGLDGVLYRSSAEAYFCDEYLHNQYAYEVEPKYPYPYDTLLYDWYLKDLDLYIELDGSLRPETTKNKIEINKKLNRVCFFITTSTIYDKNYIKKLLCDRVSEMKK